MVTVKFYGLLRLKVKVAQMQLQANTVRELLQQIERELKVVKYKELKQHNIFVNGKNITEQRMFRTKLKDDDKVVLMSPVSGG